MSDLKIAIIGNETIKILNDNSPQQLKDADFWQLITNDDLRIPNYIRAILLDEEFTSLKTDIADNILWQAKKIIFVSIASGDIPSYVIKTAMQMAQDANIDYSVIHVKPFTFEGKKRFDIHKEILDLLQTQTGYNKMTVIESNKFVTNLPASVNKITEKRNKEIIDKIIDFVQL